MHVNSSLFCRMQIDFSFPPSTPQPCFWSWFVELCTWAAAHSGLTSVCRLAWICTLVKLPPLSADSSAPIITLSFAVWAPLLRCLTLGWWFFSPSLLLSPGLDSFWHTHAHAHFWFVLGNILQLRKGWVCFNPPFRQHLESPVGKEMPTQSWWWAHSSTPNSLWVNKAMHCHYLFHSS